jgi:hypothetical protein
MEYTNDLISSQADAYQFEKLSLERVALETEKKSLVNEWNKLNKAMESFDLSRKKYIAEITMIAKTLKDQYNNFQSDKKRIARQRLHLDLALQQLNSASALNSSYSPQQTAGLFSGTPSASLGQSYNTKSFSQLKVPMSPGNVNMLATAPSPMPLPLPSSSPFSPYSMMQKQNDIFMSGDLMHSTLNISRGNRVSNGHASQKKKKTFKV